MMTVREVDQWTDKLRLLKSKGSTILHVRKLLMAFRETLVGFSYEALEEAMTEHSFTPEMHKTFTKSFKFYLERKLK